MAAVELTQVHKAYGRTQVVRDLALGIRSGELLALLGPSGCGKTTTLRMIAGLERADGGRIHIGERLVDGGDVFIPPEKRGLGMVFQSYAVWPHKRVADNVAYPLLLRRLPKAEVATRVAKALAAVRLEGFADRMPSQLSGGQLQRVALARALVADPAVLLLDEPLSNLDLALREELRAEIAALRTRVATTMVYVTHDQGEALALADRVAVMRGGGIEQLDAPETLYRDPKTPFVAAFVGGANVLDGEVVGRTFVAGGLQFTLPSDAKPGRASVVVRPEDVELAGDGTTLPLVARLFLGHAVEYRFAVGGTLLRAVGAGTDAVPGQAVGVAFKRVKIFSADAT